VIVGHAPAAHRPRARRRPAWNTCLTWSNWRS